MNDDPLPQRPPPHDRLADGRGLAGPGGWRALDRDVAGRAVAALAAGTLALGVAAGSRPGQAGLVVAVGLIGLAATAAAIAAGRRELLGSGVAVVAVALAVGQSPPNLGLVIEAAGLLTLAELAWWSTEYRPKVRAHPNTATARWAYVAGFAGAAAVLGLIAWAAGRAGHLGIVALAAGTVAAISAVSIVRSLLVRLTG